MNGRMIVEVQVNGEVMAVCSKRKCFDGGKEFSCLLSHHPKRAGEEPQAHGRFPDTNIEGTPG